MADKPLSERAKLRLRLAAGLLRSKGTRLECPRDQFYDHIQAAIAALPQPEHDQLRGLVDWLEEYERGDPLPTK